VLTKEGRSVLESHRDRDHGQPQTFYAGLKREREGARDSDPAPGSRVVHVSVPCARFGLPMWSGRRSDGAAARGEFTLARVHFERSKRRRRRAIEIFLRRRHKRSPPSTSSRRNLSHCALVSISVFAYAEVMYATAVVEGKVVRFKLSPALARAHRENRGKTMTEREAVAFVEAKRRARALRRARPYLESRS